MKHFILPLSALVAGAFVLGACGDEVVRVAGEDIPGTHTDTGEPPEDAAPDAGPDAATDATVEPDEGPVDPGLRRLEFVEAVGDDDVACQGTNRCSYFISYTSQRTLEVRYTEDGEPVEAKSVSYEIVEDPDGLGQLSALSAPTNADGIAGVQIGTAISQIGQFEVKASVDEAGVPPLYFDVAVSPKGQVPLTVVGSYAGSNVEVTSYVVRGFRQDGSGQPDCSDLEHLYDNATANWQLPTTNLPQSVSKQDFPGLESDGTQMFTLLAFAERGQGGPVLAWGCDDVDGEVEWGSSTTVHVELKDRPPIYGGTYVVTSIFDLVSALPPDIANIVNYILDIFQSPAGGLLTLACDLGGEAPVLEDLCGFVFDDPENPDKDELTSTGSLIVDIVDALINSVAQDSPFGDILIGGSDVADILTAFQVNGTITIHEEPVDGYWEEGTITESWDGITVKWSLGQNCDPYTDENCGKQSFSFYAIQDEPPVTSTFTAYVENSWDLYIDLHPINFKYGALLDYIIQKVILPRIAGGGPNVAPVIDSYEKLISSLLGGEECLPGGGGELTCCEAFTDQVLSGGGGNIGESLVMSACETIIQLGSTYIEDLLTGLDVDTGESFVIGTLGSCAFYDAGSNRVVDGFGTQTDPCEWDVQVDVFGAMTTIDAEFWATKQ